RRHTRCYRDWSSDVCSSDLGASRQPGKLGHTLLRNVRSGGFDGRVLAVNPALGVPRLEEPCDLALISVPAPAVPEAVADAARAEIGRASCRARGWSGGGRAS